MSQRPRLADALIDLLVASSIAAVFGVIIAAYFAVAAP